PDSRPHPLPRRPRRAGVRGSPATASAGQPCALPGPTTSCTYAPPHAATRGYCQASHTHQKPERLVGEAVRGSVFPLSAIEKILRQHRDILTPVPQRRNAEIHHIQAEIEVLPEL